MTALANIIRFVAAHIRAERCRAQLHITAGNKQTVVYVRKVVRRDCE